MDECIVLQTYISMTHAKYPVSFDLISMDFYAHVYIYGLLFSVFIKYDSAK